jgi:hypothetical protein
MWKKLLAFFKYGTERSKQITGRWNLRFLQQWPWSSLSLVDVMVCSFMDTILEKHEDWGSRFLQYVGAFLPNIMMLIPEDNNFNRSFSGVVRKEQEWVTFKTKMWSVIWT